MPKVVIITAILIALYIVYKMIARALLNAACRKLGARIFGYESFARNSEKATQSIDIERDIENSFHGRFITDADEQNFTRHYRALYDEAKRFSRRLKGVSVKGADVIHKFIIAFESTHELVNRHNDCFYKEILNAQQDFFDHCLKYPLDVQQRRSIISEERNCLVVSSAGSGKTSSIVGKVKYLTEIKKVDPQKILLISYTNKAAAELTERIATPGLRGYTFHKLALDILGKATGVKPSICENTDALIVRIYRELIEKESFKRSIVKYFTDYQEQMSDEEKRRAERRELLSGQKSPIIKSLFPDMDGNEVYVRSEQEKMICHALSSLGVCYRYEERYEHQVADGEHSQYKPDFSIHFELDGKHRRIYLEHYGVDEHSRVPKWFAEDRGISYEEANARYNDGIAWKTAIHEKFGTTLITTSSADFVQADIRDVLRERLAAANVPMAEILTEDIYSLILPSGSKKEKAFIRLVATFISLLKSSCRPLPQILEQVRDNRDERSQHIIKNIFLPVYERYVEELERLEQIDFTDAILQATEICRTTHPVEYEHIIVDEFQDISVDRYNFLKALREGNPPAKLHCVGDDWQSIYRFSGSDMALFNQFPDYFGATDVCKIETTYRFGEPLVSLSSSFIQRNSLQVKKNIRPFNATAKTELEFCAYNRKNYCAAIEPIIASIPADKSVFLLGRYSFDDYYLSYRYQSIKERDKFYYLIGGRKIEFLTAHKSKGLEADYVILLQCNKDTYGFPSLVSDDPVLNYVLTGCDQYPYGEERRLFYVAMTRAKVKTFVLYDKYLPSVFVNEFLHPEQVTEESYAKHPNANKRWSRNADQFLIKLYKEGKSIKYISQKMGRSQTSIAMRLDKLNGR